MSKVYVKVPSTPTFSLVEVYPAEHFKMYSTGVVRFIVWVVDGHVHERWIIGAVELEFVL